MKGTLLVMMIIAVLGGFTQSILPWWGIWLFGLLTGFAVAKTSVQAWWGGLLGGMIGWGVLAVLKDVANEGRLSQQLGQMMGDIGSVGLIVITTLIGGLLAASGAWLGTAIRSAVKSGRS